MTEISGKGGALDLDSNGHLPIEEDKTVETLNPKMPTVIEGLARYHIKSIIGKGSMGTVLLGEVEPTSESQDRPLPARVAIKILNEATRKRTDEYRKEITMMREIDHPNVVRLYDWGSYEGYPFAVMDHFSRGSASERFFKSGPLSAPTSLQLCKEILSALVETHRHGILHLDIKPGNVLIGDDGRFLLTDFGIAQALFQDGNRRITGTPAFMSPEQACGYHALIDGRSDLFSLGAMMWPLIVGYFPFIEISATQILKSRKRETLPKLAKFCKPEYLPLAEIIDDMLAFHPRSRPGSAAQVLARVTALERGGAITDTLPAIKDRGEKLNKAWRVKLRNELSDPVLIDLLRLWGKFYRLRLFQSGEIICAEDEHSYDVYILLHGEIEVHRHGKLLAVEYREGAIMGEVAALIGSARTAKLRARGETIIASLNGAELEQAARRIPGLAVRIMKALATRLTERDMMT